MGKRGSKAFKNTRSNMTCTEMTGTLKSCGELF